MLLIPMKKLRILTMIFVFIGATIFFWLLMNGFLTRTRAIEESIPFFFESENLTTAADESVPVNIYFQSTKARKVSAATIQLKYTSENMVFDESKKENIDVTCQNNDFALTTLINVAHDPEAGTVTITRGFLNNDDAALPPKTDSGISCFGTVYFRPKPQLPSYPSEGVVSFNVDASVCEAVGPVKKTYRCDLLQGKNLVSILIEKPLLTPTLTPPQGYCPRVIQPPCTNDNLPAGCGYSAMPIPTGCPDGCPIICQPSPTTLLLPTPICKTGVNEFSVEDPCPGGFRQSSYVCHDGTTNTEGGPTSCKSASDWRFYAEQFCMGRSSCSPKVTPKPTVESTLTPSAVPTVMPTRFATPIATSLAPTAPVFCYKKILGDCNCNDSVEISDFESWRREYTKEASSLQCDYNKDNRLTLADFNIWRLNYFLEQVNNDVPVLLDEQ